MDILKTALVSGLVFGVIDMLFMLPYKPKTSKMKMEAMVSVFIQRFGTGFVIPFIALPLHPSITGALVAFVFSIPLAMHLKMFAPLLGAIIGFVIGWFV